MSLVTVAQCHKCQVPCDLGPELAPGYWYPLCSTHLVDEPRCDECRYPCGAHWNGCSRSDVSDEERQNARTYRMENYR
jgi:hypothetical protein